MPPIPHPPSKVSRKKALGISFLLFALGAGAFFLYGSIRHENKTNPQQSIKARVLAERVLLSFGTNGTLHTLTVSEGDKVSAGTLLAAQNEAKQLWHSLVSVEKDLALARLALPADYADNSGGSENLSIKDQIASLAAIEDELRKKQETASITEAKAALAYTRTQMSQTEQRTEMQVDNIRKEYLAAKDSTVYTAMQFEKASTERAAAEQRLKDMITAQQKNGAATIPAALRINSYEIQRDHVTAIRQRLAATTITAPTEGVINTVFAKRHRAVDKGEPILAFTPTYHFSKTLYVTGHAENAGYFSPGTACEVRIPTLTNSTLIGKTIAPSEINPDAATVWVEVPLDDTMPRLRYIPAEAQVTLIKK